MSKIKIGDLVKPARGLDTAASLYPGPGKNWPWMRSDQVGLVVGINNRFDLIDKCIVSVLLLGDITEFVDEYLDQL